jgi:hypothetical protein
MCVVLYGVGAELVTVGAGGVGTTTALLHATVNKASPRRIDLRTLPSMTVCVDRIM